MTKKLYIIPALLAVLSLFGACNSKEEPEKIDAVVAQSVAVTKFTLKPNSKVMANLDSVYFSIDLEHRVIYNADSLPVGTQIDKLTPIITYPSSVSKAEITMSGGQTRTGTVNYKENPSDSIDFTGDVWLRLASADESAAMTYRLKVNVHKCVGDSLMWDREAVAALPSRMANPRAQKTVDDGREIITIVEESDGTLTLATTIDPAGKSWTKKQLDLSFSPNLRSLTAAADKLYMLNDSGVLMTSSDNGLTWTSVSVQWADIIGEYNGSLLGISGTSSSPRFDIYPRPAGFIPTDLPSDFPTEGRSNFGTFSSKWAAAPIGFFTGGRRDGHISTATWAYDGDNWAKISDNPLPALSEALIVPYFSYKKTNASWIQTEYSVWLCMGGRLADGTVNETLYITYDNGVNWRKASEIMQYPEFARPGYQADGIVRSTPMEADMTDNWTRMASARRAPQMRLNYFVDGNE
ncbi:MAG: hypothetical protein K2M31_00700, partial [Muribaculaceae bacterium]|nr:hypothetical protein [Muribaculaceae bacterium]